jgi:ferric-dicitrate binding protein FerR (iron transport regulator)
MRHEPDDAHDITPADETSRLVDRYLAGELSEADAGRLRERMEREPGLRAVVDALASGLRAPAASSWNVDAAWDRTARRLDAGTVRRPAWIGRAARIAASVLLVASAGTATWWWRTNAEPSAAQPAPMRETATARGQRATVRLADGTSVTLAPESRLRYGASFTGATRNVELTGEAYFQVAHRPEQPFFIRAGGAVTRVLGTEFTVRAYAGAPDVRVVVRSGRVAFRSSAAAPNDSGAVLGRGDMAALAVGGTAPVVSHGVNVDRYTAWTEGRLVFDGVPLRDAVAELGRWYDVDVHLADDTLGAQRLTAELRGERLTEALDAVAAALDLRYERAGRTVTLRARTVAP